MNTIGSVLSRLRNKIKAVNKDSFLTDRYLYSLVMKYAPALMKREDSKNKLMGFLGIFQTLQYVELTEVDKISAKCTHITSNCTIKRTKDKIPYLMTGYMGPLIKSIRAISGPATNVNDEGDLQLIDSKRFGQIIRSKNYKYNKTKYCWFADGYLWFPDLEWDAVQIEGIFDDDVEKFNCPDCKQCTKKQDQVFSVPEYLYPEIEKFVFDDLGISLKIPQDPIDDKVNINRSN